LGAVCYGLGGSDAPVGVHSEHLVQNDDGGSGQGRRPHDIGAKCAVPAFYGDAILHCVLH